MKLFRSILFSVLVAQSAHAGITFSREASRLRDEWFHAAFKGDTATIKRLLTENPKFDVNAQSHNDLDRTALALAAGCGHQEAVKILLANTDIDVNRKDRFGTTALQIAASYDFAKEIVKILLADPRIDVNLKDTTDWTALMYAIVWNGGQITAATRLSADPRIKLETLSHSETALIHATSRGKLEIVAALINAGAQQD